MNVPCFVDVLKITDGEEIAVFDRDYYAGKTAASMKRIGKGKVYYFGGAFNEECAKAFIELENIASPADGIIDIPESIELAVRGGHIFLMNYAGEAVTVPCHASFRNLISGEMFTDKITIGGYDAVVLVRE